MNIKLKIKQIYSESEKLDLMIGKSMKGIVTYNQMQEIAEQSMAINLLLQGLLEDDFNHKV